MLKHLRITNFAILSDVSLDLAPGFNVLTGETGAGKSLIVDAVALLRGGRASADIPRAGADEAVVEAVFEPPAELVPIVARRLEQYGLRRADDGEVLIRRVISRGGRSRVHVNGGLTTVGALAEIAAVLVDLAGQHEHQGLVDVARHLDILDAFGVDPALPARAGEAFCRLEEAREALEGRELDERARAEREDFLRFQLEEIDAARLEAGEEERLAAERDRLKAAGRLHQAASRAEDQLYAAEGAVADVIAGLLRDLEPLCAIDRQLEAPTRQLGEARVLVEDAAQAFRRYAEGIAADPGRLAEIEDRLYAISRLCRKHGPTTADVLAKRDALRAELDELEGHESRRAELEAERDRAAAEAAEVAERLSQARRKAGTRLEKAVGEALAELGMAGARLSVRIERKDAIGARGWDNVELLLAANKGEEARSLARIASGGELSRIMLALKLALSQADEVATSVFDEVDAGIGGATAEVVGRQIRRVADGRQVICVTHLPQIAALADAHFRVEKFERDGRTETAVTRLGATGRREEIARMLGGVKITSRTRAHAEEMLRQSR